MQPFRSSEIFTLCIRLDILILIHFPSKLSINELIQPKIAKINIAKNSKNRI